MTVNSWIIQLLLNIGLVVTIPLVLIYFYRRLDTEYSEVLRLKTHNIVIICIVAIVYSILAIKLYATTNVSYLINTSILLGYLIFSSYTDLRTKLLYTSASLLFFMIEIIWLIAEYIINKNNLPLNSYSWTVFVIAVVMFLMSIPGWIGQGDCFIYVVLCTYAVHYRFVPVITIVTNLILANIMFVIVTIIVKIIKHDKEKHQPLTVFIAIATTLCSIVGV